MKGENRYMQLRDNSYQHQEYNLQQPQQPFYPQTDGDQIIADTQVVVIAGGKAKRLGLDIPKCLLEIAPGKKLIDMSIEALTRDGFRDFIFLLGHKSEIIIDHLRNHYDSNSDNNNNGIHLFNNFKFSIDPASGGGWGKGKAFKSALSNKVIDYSRRSIVIFPDDVIMEDNIYAKFLSHHIGIASRHEISASTLLVPGTEYPYGVAEVDSTSGIITKFIEKPFLDKPTSVGVYLFESPAYDIINSKIDLGDPNAVDLESTIMPELVKNKKLASMFIPPNMWMPINTLKEYEQALKVLSVRK
jgi:mannose-1-phosphate guanylyltransferase